MASTLIRFPSFRGDGLAGFTITVSHVVARNSTYYQLVVQGFFLGWNIFGEHFFESAERLSPMGNAVF